MPGGNVKHFVILAIVVLAVGCASLPPTIDQGEYQNYRYGFIVRLPGDEWRLAKAFPERFASHFVPEASERLLLILHNPQSGGLIAIQAGTLWMAYENVLTLQDRTTQFIQPVLDVDWHRIVRGVPDTVGSFQIYHCDASGLQWQEREGSRPLAGILHAATGSVYPLKNETISVTFYVFSEPDSFEANRTALYRMAATLSSGEVFTSRVYGR